MNDYRLKYQALDKSGCILKSGVVICKRKMSKFDAIAGYENHLKGKNKLIDKIKVIYCAPKTLLGFMSEMDTQSDSFTDLFKDAILGKYK